MQVQRKYFPEILPDNDETYISHLLGIIESVDELSCVQMTKLSTGYQFRIAASLPKYNSLLLEELLKFHNTFRIKLNLSKSIKTSATIVFDINF